MSVAVCGSVKFVMVPSPLFCEFNDDPFVRQNVRKASPVRASGSFGGQ
jgi:hypothetical protein